MMKHTFRVKPILSLVAWENKNKVQVPPTSSSLWNGDWFPSGRSVIPATVRSCVLWTVGMILSAKLEVCGRLWNITRGVLLLLKGSTNGSRLDLRINFLTTSKGEMESYCALPACGIVFNMKVNAANKHSMSCHKFTDNIIKEVKISSTLIPSSPPKPTGRWSLYMLACPLY